MSSVYIHIPFCHYRCTYCDFHFSVNTSSLKKVTEAILKEIKERANYLNTRYIQSIYFGGGTPSVLQIKDWEKIFYQLSQIFEWNDEAEITAECNPEDVNVEYLKALKNLGVNRISLGIQSFNDKILEWMGRRHTVKQSLRSIDDIYKAGIENFSVDIIFGIPGYSEEDLKKDLEKYLDVIHPPHVSAYQLTIEPKTKLNYLVRTRKIIPSDDEKMRGEFLMIQRFLIDRNYIHYEISNYAKSGYVAKHNSAYWLQKSYIGIGPSAHSYNGQERRWNVANNYVYSKNVLSGEKYYENETLNTHQQFNEYVYTRLRTMWGCDINEIEKRFGEKFKKCFLETFKQNENYFEVVGGKYILKQTEGYLMADKIASDFFLV